MSKKTRAIQIPIIASSAFQDAAASFGMPAGTLAQLVCEAFTAKPPSSLLIYPRVPPTRPKSTKRQKRR